MENKMQASASPGQRHPAPGMAKTLLSLCRDTPLYAAAQDLLESITAPLVDKQNPDLYENRIVVPPVAAAALDPAVWNVITTGLKKTKLLPFIIGVSRMMRLSPGGELSRHKNWFDRAGTGSFKRTAGRR
jgi:hypothetical protein